MSVLILNREQVKQVISIDVYKRQALAHPALVHTALAAPQRGVGRLHREDQLHIRRPGDLLPAVSYTHLWDFRR